MQPRFFQKQDSTEGSSVMGLSQFIRQLPEPRGSGRHGTAAEVKAKLIDLVPVMFTLSDVLSKEQGGLGNRKSLYRFSEVAMQNIETEALAELEAAQAIIDQESETLYELGLAIEACDQVSEAKSMVAQFEYMRATIKGFQARLETQLNRVIVQQRSMGETIDKMAGLMKTLVRNGQAESRDIVNIANIKEDSGARLERIEKLATALNTYCDLMLAYNGMFLARS